MINANEKHYISIMEELFSEDFMAAYRAVPSTKRKRILPYICSIHRRWFYSSLVDGTPFSPANFTERIMEYFDTNPNIYPIPKTRTGKRMTGLTHAFIEYKIDDHPITHDLERIIKYCSPSISLTEFGCFDDNQAIEASKHLSIDCPHYASFLLEIALFMKFIKKTTSIHSLIVRPANEWTQAKKLSREDLFRSIVDCSYALSTYGLKNFVPFPEEIFSESFVRKLITSPMVTDEIFERVYKVLGYDVNELFRMRDISNIADVSPEDHSLDMEILSAGYVLGIALDKFIFTPFGYYLRLIRPFYVIPYNIMYDVATFVSVCDDPEEAFVAFFAPCSSYTLTDLGLELNGLSQTSKPHMAVELPFKDLMDSVFSDVENLRRFLDTANQFMEWAKGETLHHDTYTFRVRLSTDKARWVHVQISGDATFHDMYKAIVPYFSIRDNEDYSFYHGDKESRFVEYPSPKRAEKKPKRDDSTATVHSLDYQDNKQMILVLYNQSAPFSGVPSKTRFDMELMKISDPRQMETFVCISRVSKAIERDMN